MLEKIFISYHFDPKARELTTLIGDLIRGFDIKTEVGDHLGGQQLTDAIKSKIDSCDAMIFLLTKRAEGLSNDWVMAEVAYAQNLGIPMIGILEDGLSWPSPLTGKEYIPFSTIDSAKFWIKLATTINIWKKVKGKYIRGTLLPDQFTSQFSKSDVASLKASYQMIDERFRKTEWKPCRIGDTVGGIAVFLEGVQDERSIKLKIEKGTRIWHSEPITQELQITFNEI